MMAFMPFTNPEVLLIIALVMRNILIYKKGAKMKKLTTVLIFLAAGVACANQVQAEQDVLNLYSSRHYRTDDMLYGRFTQKTGIKINRIEGKSEELIERLKNEGASSPADVLLTVDVAQLSEAHELGLFAPVKSALLEARIPERLRTGDWFAFSTRARVIVYARDRLQPGDVKDYADLANPRLKGMVCTRSGSHPYNLSLMSSIIAHKGEAEAESWSRGVVANFARAPKGGDTDQIKAVAAGECAVAVTNSYYVARLMLSDKPEDQQTIDRIAVVWPDQQGHGTHINVSGGGMLKHAPHKAAAVKFLEYLTSDEAQRYFADGNNEMPAVPDVKVANPALEKMGAFKDDQLPVSELSKHRAKAQMIFDRTGYR